jgi:very-short-patch-repair endonuclease
MKKSTPQTVFLAQALKQRGIVVELEHWDGHKHVDIFIPKAKIYIEIDGAQHDMRPKQVFADFNRDYFSAKEGFFTKHITNQEIENHLETIANAIAKVVNKSSNKMGDNLHKTK